MGTGTLGWHMGEPVYLQEEDVMVYHHWLGSCHMRAK